VFSLRKGSIIAIMNFAKLMLFQITLAIDVVVGESIDQRIPEGNKAVILCLGRV